MSLRIILIKEVEYKTGLSRVTIWRREKAGEFPKRFLIGKKVNGWDEAEVDAWIEQKKENRVY